MPTPSREQLANHAGLALLPDPEHQPTVTIEFTAEILGISRGLAYAAARAGELPVLKIGRRIVVPTAALRRLLEID
jgi:excisionase family DNA binding protein